MHQITRHPAFSTGVIIAIVFILSLALFLVAGGDRSTRVLFFPRMVKANRQPRQKVSGEVRVLPVLDGLEENARLLIEEIILGPLSPDHGHLVSPEVELISVVLDDGVLYANFSDEMLEQDERLIMPLEKQLQAVANTVLYNFRFIKRVFLFVDGSIPDFSLLRGDGLYDFSDGIRFSRLILE